MILFAFGFEDISLAKYDYNKFYKSVLWVVVFQRHFLMRIEKQSQKIQEDTNSSSKRLQVVFNIKLRVCFGTTLSYILIHPSSYFLTCTQKLK